MRGPNSFATVYQYATSSTVVWHSAVSYAMLPHTRGWFRMGDTALLTPKLRVAMPAPRLCRLHRDHPNDCYSTLRCCGHRIRYTTNMRTCHEKKNVMVIEPKYLRTRQSSSAGRMSFFDDDGSSPMAICRQRPRSR